MLLDGEDFIMSIVVNMGYCVEVVGEQGQERVGQTGVCLLSGFGPNF